MKVFLGPLSLVLLIFSFEVSSQLIDAAQSNSCLNCAVCTAAQICTQCNPGFFVDQVGQCTPCSDNCNSCIDTNTCSICFDGYTLDSNNACVNNLLCPANCASCSDSTTCTTCQTGFYMAPNLTCQACPISCAACINPAVCIECVENYELTDLNFCEPVQVRDVLSVRSTFTWMTSLHLVMTVLLTVQPALTPLHVPLVL